MVQAPPQTLTLAAFLALPETKPASEYLEGRVIQKPMPKGKHSVIQTELAPVANAVLRTAQIARAFNELRCTFGGRSIVPDTSIFLWSRISRDADGEIADRFESAPDWTIEVLSPGQSQTQVTRNILHCLKHGSSMGWLIDPQEKSILVFWPDRPTEIFDQPEQRLPVPAFAEAFQLTLGEVFAWLA
ncbi:MAG: Uma2 family endonuclease [Synechococcales cyanobacterium RU_4_20]|nr:Uma2 family endonuclease [Synechococcales cyanobacterium RU_4_20]NJR70450.1 Uma2 family endonuclease [Synechococcales cyanobacterium CRU_2_2]